MAFANEWELTYKNNSHVSIWPWSDVVTLTKNYCATILNKKNVRVLEFGCGAGANIPFFKSLSLDYYGIDGSETMISNLKKTFPMYEKNLFCLDFTKPILNNKKFDIIIDRSSLTHNTDKAIRDTIINIIDLMSSEAIYIGIDWFGKKHNQFNHGEKDNDEHTKKNYFKGQFSGIGSVHFTDETNIKEIFAEFDILLLQEKILKTIYPDDSNIIATYNIVAQKK